MAGTAAVVGVVSAIVGAGATYYQSQQAADDREKEKKRLEEQRQREIQLHIERTDTLASKQRALFAASGVRVESGSPLAVIEETQNKAEQERQDILNMYGYQSDALGSEASRIETTGYAETGGTLLAGTSQFAADPYNPFA